MTAPVREQRGDVEPGSLEALGVRREAVGPHAARRRGGRRGRRSRRRRSSTRPGTAAISAPGVDRRARAPRARRGRSTRPRSGRRSGPTRSRPRAGAACTSSSSPRARCSRAWCTCPGSPEFSAMSRSRLSAWRTSPTMIRRGPHPQGLLDEAPQRDLAGALERGLAALHRRDVAVRDPQLEDLLAGDDPLARRGPRHARQLSRVVLPA